MKQLHLHTIHQEEGAQFGNDGDNALPEHYGDSIEEYHAVRRHVGLADLSHQGKLIFSGSDRLSFLQKLISNDMALLSESSGIYATLLTAKGKILSDFYLFPLHDTLFMELESSNVEKTKAHLMRFRMRSQVELSSPPWGKLLLSGPEAPLVLEKYMGSPLPLMQEKSFFEKEVNGSTLLCIKRALTGETDFHLYYPEEKLASLWKGLRTAGESHHIKPVGQSALEMLRIEAGIPRYGMDFDDEILPVEAGIQSEAISYTKGCYPGQEVIARLKTYGHANKHLSGLILKGDPLPQKGSPVFQDNKEMGVITSTAHSPLLKKGIAMAYLRTKVATAGTQVSIGMPSGNTQAEVVTLPFYKSKTKSED